MLKLNNSEALRYQSQRLFNEEYSLSRLLGLVLNQPVQIRTTNVIESRHPAISEEWICLSDPYGMHLAFDLRGLNYAKNKLDHYSFLAALATHYNERAKNAGYWPDMTVCDPLEGIKGRCRLMEVTVISGQGKSLGSVRVLLPDDVSLILFPDPAGQRGYSPETSQTEKLATGRMALRLGALAIETSDFLKLHAGSKLECELPEVFESVLELGDKEFVRVRSSIESGKLKLEVL